MRDLYSGAVLLTYGRNADAHPRVPTLVAELPAHACCLRGLSEGYRNAAARVAGRFFNVQRSTEMKRGGHFAALEEPELLVEDIRAFFRPLRG